MRDIDRLKFPADKMTRQALAALTCLPFLFACGPSQATLTAFTDRAGWEAAVGGSNGSENFNGLAPFGMSTGSNGAGSIDVVLIGDPTDNRIDDGSGGADIDGSNYFHGALDFSGSKVTDRATLILGRPVTGFGADWATTTTGGVLSLTIGGDTVVFSDHFTGRGDGFLGVIADAAFSSIDLDTVLGTAEQFGMDNFTLKTVVSEPAACLLLAPGLLLGASAGKGSRGA